MAQELKMFPGKTEHPVEAGDAEKLIAGFLRALLDEQRLGSRCEDGEKGE